MLAAENITFVLPNPKTPMAYMPPEAANAFTFQTYVNIGSLSVSLFVFRRGLGGVISSCRLYSCTFPKIIHC